MQLVVMAVGKTDDRAIEQLVASYIKRLSHYVSCSLEIIPDLRRGKLDLTEQKLREGREILQRLKAQDQLLLLDERGESFSSEGFASYLQQRMNRGGKRIVFLIGGAYGFSDEVYDRAEGKLSLSKMTLTHQMVRLLFSEQLYRAMTILKGEPYHH